MVGNFFGGGWGIISAFSLPSAFRCSSFKVNLNITSIDNYCEEFALYA